MFSGRSSFVPIHIHTYYESAQLSLVTKMDEVLEVFSILFSFRSSLICNPSYADPNNDCVLFPKVNLFAKKLLHFLFPKVFRENNYHTFRCNGECYELHLYKWDVVIVGTFKLM